jgi:hypothetical protein
MSLGFYQEHPDIQNAIEMQYSNNNGSRKRVLIFAAACNNRALEEKPIGYPARKAGQVICVFSSKTHDRRSDFSPRGRKHHTNISVIGENVSAAWPTGQRQTMSGTSCATPIAAGIAVLLLEFASKDLDIPLGATRILGEWERLKAKLWEISYMRTVLRECMSHGEGLDGSYSFLKLWKLLKQDDILVALEITRALKMEDG